MPERIERDAFLFLHHDKAPAATFAQCGPCRMFVPNEYLESGEEDRCIIHGTSVKLNKDYSCGFMCQWPKGSPNPEVIKDHAREIAKNIPGSVTPEQSGLVERPVRCENCDYFDAADSECGLYKMLNEKLPKVFSLDIEVKPSSCCNANTAIPTKGAQDRSLAALMRGIGK